MCKDESLSDTIKHLLEKQQPGLLTFVGRWKDMDLESMRMEIKKRRDESVRGRTIVCLDTNFLLIKGACYIGGKNVRR